MKMLEECSPLSYIMVDNHPFRYDPSHIVTHRVHSSIVKFADYLVKVEFPLKSNEWSTYLQALNVTVRNFEQKGYRNSFKLFFTST